MTLNRREFLAAAAASAAVGPAFAQSGAANWPAQPIRMIVPFAPGGASDFTARLLQPGLSEFLKQNVVVENRGGAAGNIGMDAAARAAPDGYTIFLGNVGTLAINPSMFKDLTVKPDRDFQPVSLVVTTPGLFIAHPSFPPNNVKEFIDHVKKQPPGSVNFASPGSGSLNRLEMENFASEAGLQMTHIPYKGGAGPAVTDVLAGHVPTMFVTISSAIQHVRAGRLKAYGITTAERSPQLPDVPTRAEQGFNKKGSSSWQGVCVPAKTPRPIVEKLHAALLHATSDETVRKRMAEGGVFPLTSKTPDDFAAFMKDETERWGEVIRRTGAQPD